jgi:hypothetical protein
LVKEQQWKSFNRMPLSNDTATHMVDSTAGTPAAAACTKESHKK